MLEIHLQRRRDSLEHETAFPLGVLALDECEDLGGRVLVFAFDTLAFKRGWGAYGKPLKDISLDDADHRYTPNGPMPREFVGHLTINVSRDGIVYAADRNANRIHVTDKQGKPVKFTRVK